MMPSRRLVLCALCALFAAGSNHNLKGYINSTIDKNADGMPDILREGVDLPVYPGTRCGENFGLGIPDFVKSKSLATDSILCVGRPKNNVKEQDGDSGGPVFTTINGELVQIGVNTGSAFADEMRSGVPRDTHIGYYTAADWTTIKPWLTKIMAGDYDGAAAMTCDELGGVTSPLPTRRLKEEDHTPTNRDGTYRSLLSGATTMASKGEYPFMVSMGGYDGGQTANGPHRWGAGCDGTLVNSEVVLTAAHCVEYEDFTTSKGVWPGAYNFSNVAARMDDGTIRKSRRAIRHPCYGVPADCLTNNAYNCQSKTKPSEDIAVIILATPSTITQYAKVLGQGAYASTSLTYPVTGTVAGWGRYCSPDLDVPNDQTPTQCIHPDYEVVGSNANSNANSNNDANSNNYANSGATVVPGLVMLSLTATLISLL